MTLMSQNDIEDRSNSAHIYILQVSRSCGRVGKNRPSKIFVQTEKNKKYIIYNNHLHWAGQRSTEHDPLADVDPAQVSFSAHKEIIKMYIHHLNIIYAADKRLEYIKHCKTPKQKLDLIQILPIIPHPQLLCLPSKRPCRRPPVTTGSVSGSNCEASLRLRSMLEPLSERPRGRAWSRSLSNQQG